MMRKVHKDRRIKFDLLSTSTVSESHLRVSTFVFIIPSFRKAVLGPKCSSTEAEPSRRDPRRRGIDI